METTIFLTSSGSQLFKYLNTSKSNGEKSHSIPCSSRKFKSELTSQWQPNDVQGLKNLFLLTWLAMFQEHIIHYFLSPSKSYKAFNIFSILFFWNLWHISSKSVFLHMAYDSLHKWCNCADEQCLKFLTHHTLLISLTQNKSCTSHFLTHASIIIVSNLRYYALLVPVMGGLIVFQMSLLCSL